MDPEQQQRETYLYWPSLPVGDRLSAVWDVSEAAYSFAAAFKGVPIDDAEDLKELLRAFNEHGVRYLVVGGYAFGVHAEPRATKDLDLLHRLRRSERCGRLSRTHPIWRASGWAKPQDFVDGSAFQIGQPPARVDILQRIDGLTFDEAWQNRIEGHLDGEVKVNVISKDDLIRNKLASGREQDLLDVKKLRSRYRQDATK